MKIMAAEEDFVFQVLSYIIKKRGLPRLLLTPNGHHKLRDAAVNWGKRGITTLAVPGHDPPVEITIFIDVEINPGPDSSQYDCGERSYVGYYLMADLPRSTLTLQYSRNFLELIHLRCRDIAWLKDKLESQLQKRAQWTSPVIQNDLLQIIVDLNRERITNDVRTSGWYGIILDETSDISRTEQVSLCLSFALNGTKKEAFIGFYSTKSTEGEVLVKSAITELNLDLKNIVGKAFDGAADMKGVHKGLSTRMEECSLLCIYVHCYGYVLNLALQDTMTQIETLRNALGTIQALYNFLEANPKRHALFSDTEVQGEDLKLTLKSLSTTRWSCRWEAAKAVHEQMERIVKALLTLSSDKDPKTYSESRALLNAICDLEFVFGLCVLKVILSNTNSLCQYLQGRTVDVISACRNADLTIQTLRQCRKESWLTNSKFKLGETRAPRQTPSRRLQALAGEHAQRQTQTPESHHRINTYYASID
ncbi:Zinc finger MYM-type protein 1 [Stylophora pistillata]|uniref:Zinc finger MYM-type protein 1 n=1 Tax=Stylophora pistillata TaxID=50429 RepID=A0A2B4R8T7_STYPI|nr:Zinc finger MYM-type protein 1 [Stylophora pistillata]